MSGQAPEVKELAWGDTASEQQSRGLIQGILIAVKELNYVLLKDSVSPLMWKNISLIM